MTVSDINKETFWVRTKHGLNLFRQIFMYNWLKVQLLKQFLQIFTVHIAAWSWLQNEVVRVVDNNRPTKITISLCQRICLKNNFICDFQLL